MKMEKYLEPQYINRFLWMFFAIIVMGIGLSFMLDVYKRQDGEYECRSFRDQRRSSRRRPVDFAGSEYKKTGIRCV